MTTTARQPAGVPVGGQFAATTHAEPMMALPAAMYTPREIFEQRDAVRERLERIREQEERMDLINQVHSVRCLSSALWAKYPDAATVTIRENVDGENQYDLLSVNDAEGRYLEFSDEDDDWTREEPFQGGPNMEELVLSLNLKDNRWAAGGVATITSDKYNGKKAVIDLHEGVNAVLPYFPEEHDPATRSLSEDEQEALIELAGHGITELDDKLTERYDQYEPEDRDRMQSLIDQCTPLLTKQRDER